MTKYVRPLVKLLLTQVYKTVGVVIVMSLMLSMDVSNISFLRFKFFLSHFILSSLQINFSKVSKSIQCKLKVLAVFKMQITVDH